MQFRFILRLSMLFGVVCLLAVTLSYSIGRSQPPPAILNELETALCLLRTCPPSLIDPDPALVEIIRKPRTSLRLKYVVNYWVNETNAEAFIMFEDTSGAGLLRFGEVLQQYGMPCSVTITETETYFQYARFYIVLKLPYDPNNRQTLATVITPYLPVHSIGLTPASVDCTIPLTFATSYNRVSAWRGFTTLGIYARDY